MYLAFRQRPGGSDDTAAAQTSEQDNRGVTPNKSSRAVAANPCFHRQIRMKANLPINIWVGSGTGNGRGLLYSGHSFE